MNKRHLLSKASERSERALGSGENCGCMFPIDSEMAGLIGQKTWWDDRGMQENVLAGVRGGMNQDS